LPGCWLAPDFAAPWCRSQRIPLELRFSLEHCTFIRKTFTGTWQVHWPKPVITTTGGAALRLLSEPAALRDPGRVVRRGRGIREAQARRDRARLPPAQFDAMPDATIEYKGAEVSVAAPAVKDE
jgi:hypothetical protein